MKQCTNCGKIHSNAETTCSCGAIIGNVIPEEQKPLNPKRAVAGTGIFTFLFIVGIVATVICPFILGGMFDSLFIGIATLFALFVFTATMYAVQRIIELLFEISQKLNK
jgi:hypothetical protein